MKGYRTLAINAGLVAASAALHYGAGANLADYGITGQSAIVLLGVINIILRCMTDTPVGQRTKTS